MKQKQFKPGTHLCFRCGYSVSHKHIYIVKVIYTDLLMHVIHAYFMQVQIDLESTCRVKMHVIAIYT